MNHDLWKSHLEGERAITQQRRRRTHRRCERSHPAASLVGLAVLAVFAGGACEEIDCHESRTCPPVGNAGAQSEAGASGHPSALGAAGEAAGGAAAGDGGDLAPSGETGDTLGAFCDEEGQLRCPVPGATALWICHQGRWAIYAECVDGDACSDDGPRCKPITIACLERKPGDAFCHGDALHVCSPDRTHTIVTHCEGPCVDGECLDSTCGNGSVEPGEECDDGNADDSDACLTTCVEAICGDGFLHQAKEECDDGNDDDSDECPSTCTIAHCGDGFVQAEHEECDDGNQSDADECLSSCKKPVCGDGVVEGAEECDDGNTSSSDDCTAACNRPTCGDGFVHAGEEECDDGNTAFGDGCSATCRWEVTSIRLGGKHGCALFENGNLRCWGANDAGQLGIGTTDPLAPGSAPVVARDVSQFSLGDVSTCAVIENEAYCWGFVPLRKASFQATTPTKLDVGFPVLEVTSGPDAYHACFVGLNTASPSELRCWGNPNLGALGFDPVTAISDPMDVSSFPLLDLPDQVVLMSAGNEFTCALLSDGSVRCWGFNFYGQVGQNTCDFCPSESNPISLGLGFRSRDLASGFEHTCALGVSGSIKCWGSNQYGSLGYGDSVPRGHDPALFGDALPEVPVGDAATALAAGSYFSCALLVDGTVKCWGSAANGVLGQPLLTRSDLTNDLGDEPDELGERLPPIDLGPDAVVLEIAAGRGFVCALLDTRAVTCWGLNSEGQLGVRTDDDIVGDEREEMGAALQAIDFR